MASQPIIARGSICFLLSWLLGTGAAAANDCFPPAAPESSYWASGFCGNAICIDEQHDLVVVVRGVPELAGVVERVLEAVQE